MSEQRARGVEECRSRQRYFELYRELRSPLAGLSIRREPPFSAFPAPNRASLTLAEHIAVYISVHSASTTLYYLYLWVRNHPPSMVRCWPYMKWVQARKRQAWAISDRSPGCREDQRFS
jgi:hypothetical protein